MNSSSPARPIRIGILGCARVVSYALVRPARMISDVQVLAIASRNFERGQAFAARESIPRVHASYDALLKDPDIDIVYNPLPNSLHCERTLRALDAGHHVLCEKPIAANALEAERMADAACQTGLVLAEAFHWRYHPLVVRIKEIVDSGELGALRHVESHLHIPVLNRSDIRYQLALAGGATMDCGCYTISILRFLVGSEPLVTRLVAKLSSAGIDRTMVAEFQFPNGCTGRMSCSLLSPRLLRVSAKVIGELGELHVINPFGPHALKRFLAPGLHWLTVRSRTKKRRERVEGEPTYTGQLRAFANAVRNGTPLPTGPGQAVANMRVIDSVYIKAGLNPRGML